MFYYTCKSSLRTQLIFHNATSGIPPPPISTEFLRSHFAGKPPLALWNVSCFLRLMQEPLWTIYRYLPVVLGFQGLLQILCLQVHPAQKDKQIENCAQLPKVTGWCLYWFFSHYNGYHPIAKNREAISQIDGIALEWLWLLQPLIAPQCCIVFKVDMICTVLGPMISLEMVPYWWPSEISLKTLTYTK